MANVSKLDLTGHETGVSQVANFISQVDVNGVRYDIATHHGIKFTDGTGGNSIVWNGVSDIEVVIPSVADIVQKPIEFVGTVAPISDQNNTGTITYNNGADEASEGNLVFIAADCTFDGKACEAGDMAIYDGTKWVIVSGENQITVTTANGEVAGNNTTFTLNGTAKEIFDVEGKKVLLKVDYTGVKDVLTAETNAAATINLAGAKVNVSGKKVTLSHISGGTDNISTAVSIDLPTALADGTVTISDKVMASTDFSWLPGSYPTAVSNSAAIAVNVSDDRAIGKVNATDGNSGDYITDITGGVISGATIVDGTSGDHQLAYVSGLSSASGKSFISKWHVMSQDEKDGGKTADFTIPGVVSVVNTGKTFVSGLTGAADSGDVVSSVSVGAVTLVEGSGILTGISAAADDSGAIVTGVSFGSVESDDTKNWFVTGLDSEEKTSGYNVVTSVSIGETSLVADASSEFAASAMISAVVAGNVLSFTSGNFMTPVKASTAAHTIKGKSFVTAGVKLSGQSVSTANFTSKALNQATTAISYKSIMTGDVALSQDVNEYIWDTDTVNNYSALYGYAKISAPAATILKNTPTLTGSVTAAIPANKVTVSLTDGVAPSWFAKAPTATISGIVDTSLAVSNVSWLGVADAKKNIALADTWSLVEASNDDADAIEVAVANSAYSVTGGTITIDAGSFVTDVKVSGVSIIPSAPEEDDE